MNKSLKIFSTLLGIGLAACTSQTDEPNIPQLITDSSDSKLEVIDSINVGTSEIESILGAMFNNGEPLPQSRAGWSIETINDKDNNPAVYVVNMPDDGGFILISATKRYNPVLAFNNTGHFHLEKDSNPLIDHWMDTNIEYIKGDIEVDAETKNQIKSLWEAFNNRSVAPMASRFTPPLNGMTQQEYEQLMSITMQYEMEWGVKGYQYTRVDHFPDWTDDDFCKYRLDVEPHIYPPYFADYQYMTYNVQYSETDIRNIQKYLETKWGQGHPFNQVFPSQVENGKTYTPYTGCASTAAAQIMYYHRHPAKFKWDEMTLDGNKAVSELMYDITSNCDPSYSSKATGITTDNIKNYLNKNGYHATKKNNFNKATVENELLKGRPVFATCTLKKSIDPNYSGRHAFVLAGVLVITTTSHEEWWTYLATKRFGTYNVSEKLLSSTTGYYANWGGCGSGDGYYFNIENCYPPINDYTSAEKNEMIVEIYPN